MRIGTRLLVLTLLLASCNVAPEKAAMDDARIEPLVRAAKAFDRAAFGFTPLPGIADVRWESRPTEHYDAMLHIYGKTSRTIAFRKAAGGFKWTGEQETFQGPNRYNSPDGSFNESIVLTFEIEDVSGHTANRLDVDYWGEDPRLAARKNLALDDIKPALTEWGY